MSIFDEPKVDTHCHLLDPTQFAYAPDVAYRPQGQEVGSQTCFEQVMACYGVRHALLVQPNSGYNYDNRCLLHALATGQGRFKGVVVVPNDTEIETLRRLQQQGVVGVAFNAALHGVPHYADIEPLLQNLAELGLWAQFQVEGDQLDELMPLLDRCDSRLRLMFDHCGRPLAAAGVAQSGFQTLLALGRERRAVVKISGEVKFSNSVFPFDDTRPYVDALLQAFGLEHCLWASDWPHLRAPYRLDYGPLLKRWERHFSPAERRQIMWSNPVRLFGFGEATEPQ